MHLRFAYDEKFSAWGDGEFGGAFESGQGKRAQLALTHVTLDELGLQQRRERAAHVPVVLGRQVGRQVAERGLVGGWLGSTRKNQLGALVEVVTRHPRLRCREPH